MDSPQTNTILILCVFCGMVGMLIGISIEDSSIRKNTIPIQQINFTRNLETWTQTTQANTISSLISNTEIDPSSHNTILHLSNGMALNQTNNTIHAGQSITLTYITIQPVCSYKIYANSTIYNGTIDDLIMANKYHFNKIPNDVCDKNVKLIRISDWHLNK